MKFRNRKSLAATKEDGSSAGESTRLERSGREGGRGRWSTAFVIMGSALVGATAVALWNRRTIAKMHAQIEAGTAADVRIVSKDEEIF